MASVFFDPNVGGDGTTVTDDADPNTGLRRGGYQQRFVPALQNTVDVAKNAKDNAVVALTSKEAAALSEANASNFAAQAGTSANSAASSAASALASSQSASASAVDAANSAAQAQEIVLGASTGRPTIRPSLNLDFVNQQVVDRRINVGRNSPKTYFGQRKVLGDENLLRYSEAFDNGVWVKAGTTVTSNTDTAPDGTLTADTLTDDNATNSTTVLQSVIISNSAFFSVYIKKTTGALTHPIISAYVSNIFDMVKLDTDTGIAYPVENSDGANVFRSPAIYGVEDAVTYWRVFLKTDFTGAVKLQINPALNTNDIVSTADDGAVTGSIVIWGAQLESAREGQTKPTAYVRTDNYPVRTFFTALETAPANSMPVEFDPVSGECLGIKPESQQTNLLTYSEEFDNSVWEKLGAIAVTSNVLVAPDSNLTADLLLPSATNSSRSISRAVTVSSNSFSYSAYFKFAGYRYAYLYFATQGFAQISEGRFDLIEGTGSIINVAGASFSSISLQIVPAGNGWFRCSVSATGLTSLSRIWITTNPNAVSNSINSAFTGDGYSGVYLWGAQLEASNLGVPSSYIPTTTAQVTRLADNLTMPVSEFDYNQNEGTLYAEAVASREGVDYIAQLGTGTDNRLFFLYRNAYQWSVRNQNITQAQIDAGNVLLNAPNRFVGTYKPNEFYCALNGALVLDSTGTPPSQIKLLTIGSFGNSSGHLNGYIRTLRYYPKALSALEAQSLSQV